MSRDDQLATSKIQQAVRKLDTVGCNLILDEDDALDSKRVSDGSDKGVFIMKEEFARGFDIRFACEAYVVIFNERSYFKASMIEQMVGRANRTQGTQTGRVFVTSTVACAEEQTIEYFRKSEK